MASPLEAWLDLSPLSRRLIGGVPSADKADPISARVRLAFDDALYHDASISPEENELRRLLRKKQGEAVMDTVGIAAAKYATMVTRPMRVNAAPAAAAFATGSGPHLNPVKFTPGPNTFMSQGRHAIPPGLSPTPFKPPTAEAQFSAASQASPIGPAAQAGHQAGFHFDPFSGGEFKVRRASLGTDAALFAVGTLGVKAAMFAQGSRT